MNEPMGRNGDGWSKAVTAAAVGTALTLLLVKLAAWLLSDSVAVLGALVDSGLDLVASGAAFLAVRVASVPPDDNHRFGHGKAEAVSALVQTVLIAASGTLVLVESIGRLLEPEPVDRPGVAAAALGLAVILTLGLVALQSMAIRRSDSLVIKADRAHYTGDLLSNGGLLLAVLFSAWFELPRADAFAGLVAAAFLFWSVKEVAEQALPQLMDEELPEDERRTIETIIMEDGEVDGFKNLRTRKAGPRRFIQVDVIMPGDFTLHRAHDAAHRVTAALKARFPLADVVVHQDTGD